MEWWLASAFGLGVILGIFIIPAIYWVIYALRIWTLRNSNH